MATIDKQGRLHGKAGPLVYRTIGEINVVQSRPRRFKQTQATRESGVEFGLASNTARIMREALWPVFYSPDKGMVNRFTSRILKCIRGSQTKGRGERDLHDGDLSYLVGFQFNKNSPLQEALRDHDIYPIHYWYAEWPYCAVGRIYTVSPVCKDQFHENQRDSPA